MFNYSCIVHSTEDASRWLEFVIYNFDHQMKPDMFIRLNSHPFGFRSSLHTADDRLLHIYEVSAILEKEPLTLNDSRVWC
jgi:hypothetical protein